MISELECVISGRVQLVMFRDFVRRSAAKLGIVGFVENLPDGTVHVMAQGERSTLELFLETYLKHGPIFAKVLSVAVEWKTPLKSYPAFGIRFSSLFDRF